LKSRLHRNPSIIFPAGLGRQHLDRQFAGWGEAMAATRIAANGEYLAQCEKCKTWVKVTPQILRAELFFEVLQASFLCCALLQSATFTIEKDTTDFH
jgi:hypothetical protein